MRLAGNGRLKASWLVRSIALVASIVCVSGAGAADWRPEKPVEIISGVAAGGALLRSTVRLSSPVATAPPSSRIA